MKKSIFCWSLLLLLVCAANAQTSPASTQDNGLPNLTGKWIYKGADGSNSISNPWEFIQTGDKVKFTVNGTDSVNGVPLTGRIKGDSFIIDVKGSGTIEQNGNVIRFRDGDYMVKEGFTGEIGKSSGIPRVEQNCIDLAQGKVAWNKAGNTAWERSKLYMLCMATDNPSVPLDCFKAQLKKQDNIDKNINTCSEMIKILNEGPNQAIADEAASKLKTFTTGAQMVEELLTAHNKHRADVGVAPLKWSESLAKSAQDWANKLAKKKRMDHSNNAENLFMNGSRQSSYTDVVDAWASEKKDFVAGIFPNISRTRKWQDVGHYAQIIWRKTTVVGCGMATDGKFDYVVCHYDAKGNVPGQSVY